MDALETDPDKQDTKQLRLEHPSGWLAFAQHDAVPILVDALLDLPPGREFNKTEFAEHAGVTRQTVGNYVEHLQTFELVEPVPNTSPQRYRVAESTVVEEIRSLNNALNTVGES